MFLDKFKLDGKIAHITGGAKGIGLSIAHALGEAGAKLVLTDRKNTNVGVEDLKKANYDVSFYEGDLLDKSVPQKVIDYTLENNMPSLSSPSPATVSSPSSASSSTATLTSVMSVNEITALIGEKHIDGILYHISN